MILLEFIKNNLSWREILSNPPYNLIIYDDDDFIMLKYSQYDSDFTNELVRECRGIIIDKDYNAVCVPFSKFANYGESYADEIDWTTATVEEKIDGSLIKVWCYKNKWNISTNGTIFAKKALLGSQHDIETDARFGNYEELFIKAAEIAGLDIESLNPQFTYMFELCSPYSRIVVPHTEIKIYHIGTRNNFLYNELEIDIGVEKPKTYSCNNLTDLIEMASKLKYCEEGYVVKDKNYKRIKVKSPSYVAVHHLISDLSDKKLLELIRKNETSEFLVYFPEYKHYIDTLENKLYEFEKYIISILSEKILCCNFDTRKEFAAVVTKTKYPAFFFSYYDKRVSTPLEWLWSFPNDKVLELLGRVVSGKVTVTIEIDEALLRDVEKLCKELGITVEQLVIGFFHFCSMRMSSDDRKRIHGHDERIREDQFLEAIMFYQKIIKMS